VWLTVRFDPRQTQKHPYNQPPMSDCVDISLSDASDAYMNE